MMRKALVAFVVSFGLASATQAAEQGGVVGDAAAGKGKVAVCTACHGADGNSPAPTFPKLAGQGERYLIKQLHEINRKDNRGNVIRSVPTMVGQTEHLTDQDIADIAAFYASQPPSIGQAREALAAKGEEIYRGGISGKGVPACAACHAPDGLGNAPAGFPRLSGQHAEYVATSLRAYRAAEDGDPTGRANDGDIRTMRIIAYSLSDSEIEAVSSYISGLH